MALNRIIFWDLACSKTNLGLYLFFFVQNSLKYL
jgi:hypothetical protein